MGNIVNDLTGEVYDITKEEIEELKKNELVSKQNELVSKVFTDEVYDLYEQLEALKEQKEMFEHRLKKLFADNGIKKFENDYLSITFTPEHTTKRVDTDLLKKAGLYDEFSKESKVAESIRVRFKND